jgi:hypothetical protein
MTWWPKGAPRVIVMQTLIGGEPDINTRMVYTREKGFDRPLVTIKPDIGGWSKENERDLDEVVLAFAAAP